MNSISFYLIFLCIYVILILMNHNLLDLREKIDILVRCVNIKELEKFEDDKEFLEFISDNKDENNGGKNNG